MSKSELRKKKHLTRHKKQLFCGYDSLDDHDITTLINVSYKLINGSKNANELYKITFILCSLLTGRSLNSLINKDNKIIYPGEDTKFKGAALFSVNRPTMKQKSLSKIQGFAKLSNSRALILIPKPLSKILANFKKSKSNLEEKDYKKLINSFLKSINKQYKTRLTLARTRSNFHQWCIKKSVSEVVYAAISGQPISYHAGIYYTRLNNEILLKTIENYWDDIFKNQLQYKPTLPALVSTEYWGSNRVIDQHFVSMLFAFIQRNIKYYKNNLDYISLHNYFTTYTISILQLSTGLRPKVGFFEDINRFNLDDKTVIICDKGEKSRRLIKLSKSAHTQLIEYIKFIKILTKRTYYQDRNVSEELTKKIDGTSNLLSLIERDPLPNEIPSLWLVFSGYKP